MASRDRTKLRFSYTGSGNELVEIPLTQVGTYRMDALSFKVNSTNATGMRACLLDNGQTLESLTGGPGGAIADVADTDQVFRVDDAGGYIAISAAGTIVDSPLPTQPTCHKNSTLVLDVQGVGEWIISGWVSAIRE